MSKPMRITKSFFGIILILVLLSSGIPVFADSVKSDAFVAFRDATIGLNVPKGKTWMIGQFDHINNFECLNTAGSPVRFVRVEYSPILARKTEKIVVTLSDDGYLDAYVWDGSSWAVTNNIGFPGTTAAAYKCFDLAYEQTSGRALLVYSSGATTNEIVYRIWTYGSGWGDQQLLNLPWTTGIVRFIHLASCPATRVGDADDNEISMIYLDANTDTHGYVWTGSAWDEMGATAVWDATCSIATTQCVAVAYERTTGEALFIWGDSVVTDFYYKTWDGTTLSNNALLDIPSAALVGGWSTLKADPSSDNLLFVVGTSSTTVSELETAYWDGDSWTVHDEHDAACNSNAGRPYDFAWEPTDGKGLLVWGTTSGLISYKTFTAPDIWNGETTVTMIGGLHLWVQLRTNPVDVTGDVKILGVVATATVLSLGLVAWDGTTFSVKGGSIISTSSIVLTTYECFELEFMRFEADYVPTYSDGYDAGYIAGSSSNPGENSSGSNVIPLILFILVVLVAVLMIMRRRK